MASVTTAERHGLDGLAEDFSRYRRLLGDRNLVYRRLLTELEALLVQRGDPHVCAHLARTWRSRGFVAYYERPLLLQAALRFDALSVGPGHPLAAALRSQSPDPEAVTSSAVRAALDPERVVLWLALASRRVQTNDVSRSVAWLWPTSLLPERPVVLVDVGCSAGLNLIGDRLGQPWTRADGAPFKLRDPSVLARHGFDPSPIDAGQEDEAQWLRACIWPGDTARLSRLDGAIAAFRRERPHPALARVSARHVVPRLHRIFRDMRADATLLILQTFVRDYMDAAEHEDYQAQLAQWMAEVPAGRVLVCELELADDGADPPAELVVWPSGHPHQPLARCGYHPSVIHVDPAGVRALQGLE
ncbi:MAG: DUF2332 family protein [Sandaracinaceae bacterium]